MILPFSILSRQRIPRRKVRRTITIGRGFFRTVPSKGITGARDIRFEDHRYPPRIEVTPPDGSCSSGCPEIPFATRRGAVAQLGERSVRNAEVEGSIPFGSTNAKPRTAVSAVLLLRQRSEAKPDRTSVTMAFLGNHEDCRSSERIA